MKFKAWECSKGGRVVRQSEIYDIETCFGCDYQEGIYCTADISCPEITFKTIPDLPVIHGGHLSYSKAEMEEINKSLEKSVIKR
jgi:hypothetical protein